MASEDFGRFVEHFLSNVTVGVELPADVQVLRPYTDPEVRRVLRLMCRKYYAGGHPRVGVWGINPGRFGAGVTGLSFTDPWAVAHDLGIPTTLEGRRELSAEFISRVIAAYGGAQKFYRDVYMSALCPLGFTRHDVNINFYDDVQLAKTIRPKIIEWMSQALDAGVRRDVTIVLGAGKLRSFMEKHIRTDVGLAEV
ncbi:MAG TPA: DUF4918 domain-containing protein, partial [Bacteroidetes bacterium]|nr:DUF4918 domain-containing protein [Bacteroidota bacterium]